MVIMMLDRLFELGRAERRLLKNFAYPMVTVDLKRFVEVL
jgi:hypothetical protein